MHYPMPLKRLLNSLIIGGQAIKYIFQGRISKDDLFEQLMEAGIPSGQIVSSGECTGAHVDRFYSYRVEKGNTGRMLALLGRRMNNALPV